jgi:ATP-dependent Clp protease ATP-binding subunit ClpA
MRAVVAGGRYSSLRELVDFVHGRRSECAALDGLLARVRGGRSAVLVLRGEAGIGKTALLGYLTQRAAGFSVARRMGVDSEIFTKLGIS